jgi:hypothetical protein
MLAHLKVDNLFETADAVPASNSLWLEQVWENRRLRREKLYKVNYSNL